MWDGSLFGRAQETLMLRHHLWQWDKPLPLTHTWVSEPCGCPIGRWGVKIPGTPGGQCVLGWDSWAVSQRLFSLPGCLSTCLNAIVYMTLLDVLLHFSPFLHVSGSLLVLSLHGNQSFSLLPLLLFLPFCAPHPALTQSCLWAVLFFFENRD